jgi:hypothetical protein
MIMKTTALIALLALTAGPAVAGEGLFCDGPKGLHVNIPLAAPPGLSPLSAEIKLGDRIWTTAEGVAGATQIMSAQSVRVDDRYYFDFTDPNYEGILVKVRLFRGGEGDEAAIGGTLVIPGTGAWAISCDIG